MAWFPASLIKHTGAYRHARQRCAYGSLCNKDALATLNSNNFVVYGQKHKVLVLVFLVILRPRLSRFGEIQETLLSISSKGLGDKIVISCLGTVDDLMHYCSRPLASCYSASSRPRHLGVIVYSYFMPVCSIVKTITPRCRGRPDALLHEAEGRVQ